MTEPLRPMSTGQVLDHTFALYRNNFLLFLGIATVGPAANVIFQLLTVGANVASPFAVPQRRAASAAAFAASMGLSMVAGYIIMLAGMAISHAATVKAVAAVHLGQKTSILDAYKGLRGRVWSLFGTCGLIFIWMVLWTVAMVAAATAVMIPVFMAAGAGQRAAPGTGAALIAGLMAFAIFALAAAGFVAIFARYALAIQACIVEKLGPRASLKRSVLLSKGSRWRVIVVYLIFFLLAVILAVGFGEVAGGAGILLHNKTAAALLIYLAGFIAGSITGPLATIGLSLLYYDERIRKEAFDLQLMMLSLDAVAVPIAAPAQV